jgi:hypothetical protein
VIPGKVLRAADIPSSDATFTSAAGTPLVVSAK